jgi:hypothetical protein
MTNRQKLSTIGFILLVLGTTVSLADKPDLLATTPLSQTAVQLRFNRELDAKSAENVENYRIHPDIKVEYATLDKRKNIVLLETAPLEIGKQYTMDIENLQSYGLPRDTIDAHKAVPMTLLDTMELTFGEGAEMTFSGVLQDTLLIVNPKNKRTKNHNAGGEPYLLCTPIGSVSFVAFEIINAFEDIGIMQPERILEASVSLYVEPAEKHAPQQVSQEVPQEVIIRRVLLPWKEGQQKSQPAKDNELTYNSALHRNLPWNKPPAQAMLAGIDGDNESDYNGSEDVAHRIDGTYEIQGAGKRYTFKSELLTDAIRFWVANPDYNYGYLFALRDGSVPIVFASKEAPDENLRPVLKIRYQTQVEDQSTLGR